MAQVAALDPEWKLGAFTLAAIVIVVRDPVDAGGPTLEYRPSSPAVEDVPDVVRAVYGRA